MKGVLFVALLLGALTTAAGAAESGMHAGKLAHELDRLAHTGRVLYVAAHPDDENTRLLAFLANERHLQAAYLSMTRGGGGQNLIGPEQGDLLDVIRTEELLAARRIDGAQQRFTRMRDFGYSKTAAETLAIWGHDEALADLVWVIRTFQPDVIITRFDEDPPNHGHHTASAILAREAFTAAADPKRFPEQLAHGTQPWKTDRLLRNLSSWRQEPVPKDAIELDVSAYDARLGVGYGELAALSRSQHRSQGFGVPGDRGALIERFVWLAGTRPEHDIFDGLELGWNRFGELAAPLTNALSEARQALDRDHPEQALPMLLAAHQALERLPHGPRADDARRALDELIASVVGLFVRPAAVEPTVVPGGTTKVDVEVVLRRPATITLRRIVFPGTPPLEIDAPLILNQEKIYSTTVNVPIAAAVTTPAWLAQPAQPGHHTIDDPRLIGPPLGPPALAAHVELVVGDRDVVLDIPVVHSWTDPVQGERLRSVVIVPPATVTPLREAVMIPNGGEGRVVLRLRAGRDDLQGEISLPLPPAWQSKPAKQSVRLRKRGDETTIEFSVRAPVGAAAATTRPTLVIDGRSWTYRETTIDYPHIPYQLVLQPATLRLVPLSIALPPGAIGYIRGSGDTVADDLAHIGLSVSTLDDDAIRQGDFDRFAAIVVGIRAYNTRDVLRAAHAKLMEFVARGGTVVVQYNTNNRLSPLENSIGPFPLEIGRDRITDEKATMTILAPQHPALNRPNKISASDFDGWVQERGIYFATKWDPQYTPLFAASDPGEAPLTGSTLVARHGKGRYVYSGLVFFRELPAGVPGAYRLLVNLLAKDE